MTYTQGVALGWFGALVFVVGLYVLPKVRRQRVLRARYGAAAMPSHGVFKWATLIPLVLLVCAAASLALAIGQFRVRGQASQGSVVLAIDVSRSMDQTDVQPDRLSAAQAAALSFSSRIPAGFRIGVVTFAGKANAPVVPTADREQVASALRSLTTSQGTVIGDGLSLALDAIQADGLAHGSDPAAVVLLSDGMDTGSEVPPDQAADRAREMGIPVFTVTVSGGSAVGAGEVDAAGATAGGDLLTRLASATGGQGFTAQSAGELTSVYETLGSRLSYDLAAGSSAGPFMLLAALFALSAGGLAVVIVRRQ